MTRMRQAARQGQRENVLVDAEERILGVDTHKDTHVAAVITVLGGLVDTRSFPATAAGYRQLLAWARSFGVLRRAGVEGTGCYGAALSRYLRAADVQVVEVNRPDRAIRRRRGKSDPVDAETAARAVLSGRGSVIPKIGDGPAEVLRVFKLARDSAVKARTQAINQLRAVLVCADPALRESMSGLGRATLIRACAELPDPDAGPATTAAVVHTLRLLARRIGQLSAEARDLQQRMTRVISAHTPQLLDRPGVGADNAAALLIAAGDNPDRLTSDAAFAALCGVSPVEASSGMSATASRPGGELLNRRRVPYLIHPQTPSAEVPLGPPPPGGQWAGRHRQQGFSHPGRLVPPIPRHVASVRPDTGPFPRCGHLLGHRPGNS